MRKPKQRDRPEEPPCYSCVYAIKRGHFRLCSNGKDGYKHIGIWEFCDLYKNIEECEELTIK